MSTETERVREELLARARDVDKAMLAQSREASMLRCASSLIAVHETDSATIADLRANVKRTTGERNAARAEVERLQDDVARLRHEVTRLQSLASTAADLLEVEEIKREIMEAGGSWHSYCAVGCVHPVSIYDDKHYANFGTPGQPATLADWHAAIAWLRSVAPTASHPMHEDHSATLTVGGEKVDATGFSVTAPAPEPEPERMSEPIDGMSSERCAEVAAEARLARGAMVDADAKSWIAVWIDSGGEFSCRRGLMSEAAASRYSLVKAADARALLRENDDGRECVILPPLPDEEGAD